VPPIVHVGGVVAPLPVPIIVQPIKVIKRYIIPTEPKALKTTKHFDYYCRDHSKYYIKDNDWEMTHKGELDDMKLPRVVEKEKGITRERYSNCWLFERFWNYRINEKEFFIQANLISCVGSVTHFQLVVAPPTAPRPIAYPLTDIHIDKEGVVPMKVYNEVSRVANFQKKSPQILRQQLGRLNMFINKDVEKDHFLPSEHFAIRQRVLTMVLNRLDSDEQLQNRAELRGYSSGGRRIVEILKYFDWIYWLSFLYTGLVVQMMSSFVPPSLQDEYDSWMREKKHSSYDVTYRASKVFRAWWHSEDHLTGPDAPIVIAKEYHFISHLITHKGMHKYNGNIEGELVAVVTVFFICWQLHSQLPNNIYGWMICMTMSGLMHEVSQPAPLKALARSFYITSLVMIIYYVFKIYKETWASMNPIGQEQSTFTYYSNQFKLDVLKVVDTVLTRMTLIVAFSMAPLWLRRGFIDIRRKIPSRAEIGRLNREITSHHASCWRLVFKIQQKLVLYYLVTLVTRLLWMSYLQYNYLSNVVCNYKYFGSVMMGYELLLLIGNYTSYIRTKQARVFYNCQDPRVKIIMLVALAFCEHCITKGKPKENHYYLACVTLPVVYNSLTHATVFIVQQIDRFLPLEIFCTEKDIFEVVRFVGDNELIGNKMAHMLSGNILNWVFKQSVCATCNKLQEYGVVRGTYEVINNSIFRPVGLKNGENGLRVPANKISLEICDCQMSSTRGIYYYFKSTMLEQLSYANTKGNELMALTMRYMRETQDQKNEVYVEMQAHLIAIAKKIHSLVDEYAKDIKMARAPWIKRYPEVQRKKLNDDLENSGPLSRTGRVFTKFESVVKLKHKPYKPRAIFPKTAAELNKTGPTCYGLKKRLSKIYDGKKCPILFGAGKNPSQLGYYLVRALDCPYWSYNCFSADLSMCETNMRLGLLQIERLGMQSLGAQRRYLDYTYGKPTINCVTMHGTQLTMPNVRLSGTSNTTIGNTLTYSMCLWAALNHVGVADDQFICLISGDDCALMVRDVVPNELVVKAFSLCEGLGLAPELKMHDSFWEMPFFSGRFNLYMRPNGQLTLRHYPMIGRFMYKNFSTKTNPRISVEQIAYDTAYARNATECKCVPILEQYNKKIMDTLRLTYKGTEEKSYKWIDNTETRPEIQKTVDTYLNISLVYGIDVVDLIEMETRLKEFGDNIDDLFYEFYLIDVDAIAERM
jgi:hypothetical protein